MSIDHEKKLLSFLQVASVVACATNSGSSRTWEMNIRYGAIVTFYRVSAPSAATAGTVVEGFAGLVLARNPNPGHQPAASVVLPQQICKTAYRYAAFFLIEALKSTKLPNTVVFTPRIIFLLRDVNTPIWCDLRITFSRTSRYAQKYRGNRNVSWCKGKSFHRANSRRNRTGNT